MLTRRFVASLFSVAMMVLDAGMVCGQDYPNKAIRIVTAAPGANLDFTARLIAQGISDPLGQPVIVDNRTSGTIPAQVVLQAPPDGYTLLLYGSTFWIGPLLQKTPYDPVKDFLPITMTNRQPNVLVVHPSLPVRSVKDLIALAKARPGELNYASGATGSATHLAAELFNHLAGVNIVRISYSSASTQNIDLIGGRVQLEFGNGAHVMQYIKSGKLRALAVGGREPSALYPDLPTVAASGVPGYESGTMTGIFAPAKTPAAIINRLNQEIVRFLNTTEAKETFFSSGAETVGSSPEQFAITIKVETAKWGKVIRDAGVRAK